MSSTTQQIGLCRLFPQVALLAVVVLTAGCAARDTATVVRIHSAAAPLVAAAEVESSDAPPVLTFAAATRDEPDFAAVYDKTSPAYAAALNAATRANENEKSVWLTLTMPIYHLSVDEENRLLYIGAVETVYGEGDYRLDYHLYRTDGETTEPVLTDLGYYRQQGEALDFRQVVGLTALEDGALLVVSQSRGPEDDQSTMTATVYDRDYAVMTPEGQWPGKTGQYSAMRYYDGMVYYLSSMRQLHAVRLADNTAEAPLSALNTAVFGFDVDADGLLHIIAKKQGSLHFTYTILDAVSGATEHTVSFYGQGQLPYRVSVNPADGIPYAAGNNQVSRLTIKAPHINPVYEVEMRLHDGRYAASDGFVFDRAGNAYVARLTDTGAEIWRLAAPASTLPGEGDTP